MEQPTAPGLAKKKPLRRGQIRNQIIRDFFKCLAALVRSTWANGTALVRSTRANGTGGGAGKRTQTSSSPDNSEGTSE